LVARERQRRIELGFPPATAMAAVSGAGAAEFIESFGTPLGVDVLGPADSRWLLRAPDHRTLCDALAATPRPRTRTRIEVDPLRI
jgi:primosomal protein N' (replication factor Y)